LAGREHFVRLSQGLQSPTHEESNAVSIQGSQVKIVEGHQYGQLLLTGQFLNQVEQDRLVLQIQVGGRLIQKQDWCLLGQGPRQKDTLLLAPRQLSDHPL
jgi:hypothetical protein